MRLGDLLQGHRTEPPPPADVEVCGIAHDSRRVRGGDLFVAIRGQVFDGRKFAADAVRRGAVAVLADAPALEPMEVPWLQVDAVRPLMAPLAARLYDHPEDKLSLVGITGTNGKSTVASLVGHVLDVAGWPAGVMGTLGYRFAGRCFGDVAGSIGPQTTPEATDFYRALEAMRSRGASAVAMEVSSHALAMGRVAGAAFEVAVFTNLTHDHLDFHGDMESYFEAKSQLFEQVQDKGHRVIGLAGDFGQKLAQRYPDALTFGPGGDVYVVEEELDFSGMRLTVRTPRGSLGVRSHLLGAYNRDNVLAAVATAEALELPRQAIVEGLLRQQPLPGRLEPVDAGQGFPVLVDYAHTPDALRAVLDSLRGLGDHRLAVVFGCGGDRDPTKRRPMGRIVGERADLPVATSDNPRGEDPQAILDEVEAGLQEAGCETYRTEPDRRRAIELAVQAVDADTPWIVLVAGKGHETVQIVGDQKEPFDDRLELAAAIQQRAAGRPADGQEVSHGSA